MRCWLLVLALSVAGCGMSHGSEDDDAGALLPGEDGGVGPPRPRADAGPLDLGTDAGPHDLRGEAWAGYIESYMFPSGSDAVIVVFDEAAGDGPRRGVVVFGDGEHPPPATDPEVGYPPGVYDPLRRTIDPQRYVHEGFVYPIEEATAGGARVRVTVDTGVLWADWCALQTAYPLQPDEPDTGYECLPNLGFSGGETCALGDGTPVDCFKLELCIAGGGRACACTASGCVASERPYVTFDFHVTGDNGDGTISLHGERLNVHLVRR